MRAYLSALIILAAPVSAQTPSAAPPSTPVAAPTVPAPVPAVWNPAADYITAGQDEPGYRSWYLSAPWRPGQVKQFNDYLATYQVAGILPTWQLLRTATQWEKCGGQPFEVPPTEEWPHIVQTLRYIHDYVIPAVGPVEAVSGYRNPSLNTCAGGAPESAHKHYAAIDMVPLHPITREALMHDLCALHAKSGEPYGVGLGFYAFLRFHVDTTKYRRWGTDPTVASCPPIIRPSDIASVGYQAPPPVTPPTPPAGDAGAPPTSAESKPVAATVTAPPPIQPPAGQPQLQQH
jgi:hypothetical protein